MTPKNFYDKLTNRIQEELGSEWTTELCTDVLANNGKKKIVIVLGKKGATVYPRISLEAYFEEYMNGRRMDKIMEEILSTVHNAIGNMPQDSFRWIEDWELVKDHIYFRLVSKKKNQEILDAMVYEEFCDLMAVAAVQVSTDEKSIQTMRITKELLPHWGVTEAEVLKVAKENTENLFPGTVMDMVDVISTLLDSSEKELLPSEEQLPRSMYVLTNVNKINGASVMMYDSLLEKLYEKIGVFVLLPSSIHEVIACPLEKETSFYGYQQMVADINQACVSEEEVLSDSVYVYDGSQVLLAADENGVYCNEDDFNN